MHCWSLTLFLDHLQCLKLQSVELFAGSAAAGGGGVVSVVGEEAFQGGGFDICFELHLFL